MVVPPWLLMLAHSLQWLFEKGLNGLATAYKTSRAATEIAIVGCVIFVALVFFGVFKRPDIVPDLAHDLSVLSAKLDSIEANMASKEDVVVLGGQISGLMPAKRVTTSAIVRKPKPKDAE